MPIGLPASTANESQTALLSGNLPMAIELAINPRTLARAFEANTVPGTPFQVTIGPPNGGVFCADSGVRYSSNLVALTRVASAPTVGQYSADVSTGIYTFAAADAAAGVQISYTYADGSLDVNWCITGGSPGLAPVQIAAGSMHMQPTDKVAKLLYVIRGAWLQALQGLTMSQIVPAPWVLTPSFTTGLPKAGASFYTLFPVDMIAALPSNPANAGL